MSTFVATLLWQYDHKGLSHKLNELSFWHSKFYQSTSYDYVVLGDSRVLYAVSPQEFSLSTLNFAFPSVSLTEEYLLASLQRLSVGGTILVGLSAQSLTDLSLDESFQRHKKKYRENKFFPQFFYRIEALRSRYGLLEILKTGERSQEKPRSQITFEQDGWQSIVTSITDETATASSYRMGFERFKYKPLYLENLKNFVRSIKEQGGRIGFFYAPTSLTNYQIDTDSGLSAFVLETVKKNLLAEGAVWLDLPVTKYPTYDGDHLAKREAILYSKDLAFIAKLNFPKRPRPIER